MNSKNIWLAGGVAALSLGLIALPGHSNVAQDAPQAAPAPPAAPKTQTRVRIMRTPGPEILVNDPDDEQELTLAFDGDSGSWLGVETQEVNADKAKELELSAERGAVIEKVLEDSPAAKSGLKNGDVITEINGQRVEGTAQFRRMIREIPAGRTVQLTVWRDGRSQNISVTLGKMQENNKHWMKAMPQAFNFRIPEMPEVAPIPDMPSLEWDNGNLSMTTRGPRLGIDAEDISGQLGSYFGVPDGEGVLVRDVNAGSAAEKAGVKAGDVITTLNGERIHGLAELRSKIAASAEGKTAKLGVLRNRSALTLEVEIPAMKQKIAHKMGLRTKI